MDFERLRGVWRRVFSLAWPVMAEQTTRTLMRTVDILVTAALSPAAVVAIGLADLFARFPLRIGLGLGGAAIALSSQDTGSGAEANRDEAVTQGLLIAFLTGVPFVAFGVLFSEWAVGLFPASDEAVRLGGTYLAVVFATAPARHVALVGARALQGLGDTRTPMYVNVLANGVNVALSLGLGFGVAVLPAWGVFGVGLATSAANVLSAALLVAAIYRPDSPVAFARPTDRTVAVQLVRVAVPRAAEGFATELAEFPFNALLLSLGSASAAVSGDVVNAGFQVGRRVYQQVTSPLSRGYNVAGSILVGQALGRGEESVARYEGWATAALSLCSVGGIGLVLAAFADPVVSVLGFGGSPGALTYAAEFAVVYGLSAPMLSVFVALSGALQGAGATRLPFLARVTGMFGFFVGFSYLAVEWLGLGLFGVYAGVFLAYCWMGLFAVAAFARADWAGTAAGLLRERGSVDTDD
ncbi:MATE family efflux transporter [Halopelagius longus]|uniref:Multidrug-efflux transporter n=1 Tax=Halopelagius longus TaxID=1236180 RepID=A0A1H1DU86_9EURY|nr:MATE family efflux transporter [Halopelagius longus]RDI71466.1 MATE family efflux transporter [Halopelagius longus]SDQ79819.1 putative efflux protein, MATE family [Halopelagius longus]